MGIPIGLAELPTKKPFSLVYRNYYINPPTILILYNKGLSTTYCKIWENQVMSQRERKNMNQRDRESHRWSPNVYFDYIPHSNI